MINYLRYYFWATNRRKQLDKLQNKYKYIYRGIVLDIGGRDRGKFVKPRDRVRKWVVADIEKKHLPEICLDVSNMAEIKTESIDVINAIELFEHVEKIENGLKECFRILKKDGSMLLSVPFLFPIHADPNDFQRWTDYKWKKELKKIGFKIQKLEIMGRFFTVFCDMSKALIKALPPLFKYPGYLFYPVMGLLVGLDNTNFVQNNKILNKYHGGYFIILKK